MFYNTFYFLITLFLSWNVFCTWLVALSYKHWRYVSLSQKSAWWKSVCFPVSFVICMRKVNTLCSKKKRYVTMLISLLQFSTKIPKLPRVDGGGGDVECQLRTSKSGVCLVQNWMFVDRGEEGVGFRNLELFVDVINEWPLTKLFFAYEYDFFSFVSLLSAPS